MKICSYLELEKNLWGSGISSAVRTQRKALKISKINYTTNPNENFDIFHAHTIGPKTLFYIKKFKDKGKKVIITSHTTDGDFKNSYIFSNTLSPFLKKYLAWYYNLADLIICPSNYTKKVLLDYGIKKPIQVLNNGIDINKFKIKKKPSSQKNFIALNVALVLERKGLDTFINVSKKLKDIKFFWVGKRYKQIETLKVKKIIKSGDENVSFLGFVPDILDAYYDSSIFFFPSYCENQGIVLMEAACCNLPIICRDLEVYKDWLCSGHNCLMAKNDNEFIKILKTLKKDKNLRKKIANNASKDVKEYSLEKTGEKLKSIYEKLLKK